MRQGHAALRPGGAHAGNVSMREQGLQGTLTRDGRGSHDGVWGQEPAGKRRRQAGHGGRDVRAGARKEHRRERQGWTARQGPGREGRALDRSRSPGREGRALGVRAGPAGSVGVRAGGPQGRRCEGQGSHGRGREGRARREHST